MILSTLPPPRDLLPIAALTVSSAFDFVSNLFPVSSTAAGYSVLGAPCSGPVEFNGTSGIFPSPAQVNINAGSYAASLIIWAVAGILAWTGTASYAELGGAIPLKRGAQVDLSKIFGEWAGFLFTWSAVCVLKPGSAAIIAIIFGEYVVRAAVGADVENESAWIDKGVALAGLTAITIFKCISTRLATRMGDVFMFFKVIALLGITIAPLVLHGKGHRIPSGRRPTGLMALAPIHLAGL
ncbi:hypothetical protein MMC28_002284 [Mycoblastus sanguinarius]|nr:hypothetical protein [Mycoblastus sanguinarius]